MLNEARVNYEVVNVLDEQFNPGVREAIKTYSQWPTIPQASCLVQACVLSGVHLVRGSVTGLDIGLVMGPLVALSDIYTAAHCFCMQHGVSL